MNGWLDEQGRFYEIPAGTDHKTGWDLIRRTMPAAPTEVWKAWESWVAVRDISHQDVQKWLCSLAPCAEEIRRQIAHGVRSFTHTGRKKYTAKQLEFLTKNACFVETEKI